MVNDLFWRRTRGALHTNDAIMSTALLRLMNSGTRRIRWQGTLLIIDLSITVLMAGTNDRSLQIKYRLM